MVFLIDPQLNWGFYNAFSANNNGGAADFFNLQHRLPLFQTALWALIAVV